jgi:ATP-dependent Clp protease ATP-binding subunit ClpX
VIADATSLTEAGYVGDDVESLVSRLYAAADYDVAKTQRGIIFLDEVDKISRRGESASITRDVSGEGVQQALLKLVEGTKCRVSVNGGKKHPALDQVEIDTSKILFIAGGAFAELEKIVERRQKGSHIGFVGNTDQDTEPKATPEDFVKFGMIPEFTGRFPISVPIDELTVEDLVRILVEPKNNLIAQMQFYFESDGIELEFLPEAIASVAELAYNMQIGARGLKSILESVLMPFMYDISNIKAQGVKQIQITEDAVKNQALPNFVK